MTLKKLTGLAGLVALVLTPGAFAAEAAVRLIVNADQPGHAVSPLLHGVFFEDINYGADGGLYAELVQNRSFEHNESLFSWGTVNRGGRGEVTIETDDPLNERNPHYVRLTVRDSGSGFGVANYGFGGIAMKQGEKYLFAVRARADATFQGALRAVIEDETGRPLGECKIGGLSGQWQKYEGAFKSSGTALHARFVVLATAPGRVDLDVVSLFPENTWKQRRNGLRADLVQMLADLKPAFLRFPGGCIVEGKDLPNRYEWKDTIGDIAGRKQNWSRWKDAVRDKAPQYYQTYGLGFFEFFQLCEDIGAAPLPILNCGMACQYQSKQLVPLDQLDPLVQDALDLIEFANGPATSPWGAKRAALGHPEPFNLKMLGVVGNEQWGEQYFERYQIFHAALKAKHPEIQLVTTTGPGVDDAFWKLAWDKFKSGTPADIVDEHYYRPPQWFLENATRYDAQDRAGPKVFAGEFAAHERDRRPTLRAAVSEAAFMTGLVRNSDVVTMACYAPLFAKFGASQWAPDLIWCDNTRVYGTGSYHVQALFSRNRPDVVLSLVVDAPAVPLPPAINASTSGAKALPPYRPAALPALYAVAGRDNRTNEIVIFIANPYAKSKAATLELRGVAQLAAGAKAIVLTSASPDDENSFESPLKIAPHEETVAISGLSFTRTFPAYSFTVLRLKMVN